MERSARQPLDRTDGDGMWAQLGWVRPPPLPSSCLLPSHATGSAEIACVGGSRKLSSVDSRS